MLEYYHIDIRSSNAVITVAECKFNKISNTLMYSCLFFNAEVQNGNINFSAFRFDFAPSNPRLLFSFDKAN